MNKKQSKQLKAVLTEAQNNPSKGNFNIYQLYEGYIQDLGLSKMEYKQAIQQLKIILRVQ